MRWFAVAIPLALTCLGYGIYQNHPDTRSLDGQRPSVPNTPDSHTTKIRPLRYVVANRLNLRAGPSTDQSILCTVGNKT